MGETQLGRMQFRILQVLWHHGRATARQITIKINPTAFSRYRVQFTGKNGRMLKEVTDLTATYDVRGDEGYVRARVIESNGRMAWCQPVRIGN